MSIFEPAPLKQRVSRTDDEFSWNTDGMEASVEPAPKRSSLAWFFSLLACLAMVLITRLIWLQVAEAAANQTLAEGNRIRSRELVAARGIITDRHGEILAKNVAAFQLVITPADLPRTENERESIYELAARVTNGDRSVIKSAVTKLGLGSLERYVVQDDLDQLRALELKVQIGTVPGLVVVDAPRREYAQLAGLSHILGYTGRVSQEDLRRSSLYSLTSSIGKTGIEYQYDQQLRGTSGYEEIEVDSKGFLQRAVAERPAVSGDTIKLTLDRGLQQRLGESLVAKLSETQSTAGVGIVLDPRDGSILSMVSLPDYSNNEFAQGLSAERYQALQNDGGAPLTNRAIGGTYPSGSSVKPFVAAGGLAEGVITEHTTIDAPADIRIGDFVFPDWKTHGLTDVRKALAVSSNVFFYAIGGGWDKIRGLGIERLDHYLELFGFGRKTGVDIPGEVAGLVPTPEWKKKVKGEGWFTGDTYHLSIGQGDFLVTPLQLAAATATIANQGYAVTPHFLLQDEPQEGESTVTPPEKSSNQVMDGRSLSIVREGMKQAVDSSTGSARQLQVLPVSSAGKTGTAQFGADGKTHSWFIAFAPYDDPEIAVTVLIEGGGEGFAAAEPVALDAMRWYFEHK